MAGLQRSLIGAILRKDLVSLWPLVLASLLLPLYAAAEPLIEMPGQAKELVMVVGGLATMALVLVVVHQDAVSSVRHDWLSRPIGRANLLGAKVVFVCLTIAAPLFLATVVNELAVGHDWREAVLNGLSLLTAGLYVAVPVFVLGLVTSSLVQAVIVALGLVILQVLLTILFPRGGGYDPGSRWIVEAIASGAGLAFCLAALALLFRAKRPAAARVTWICGAVVVMATIHFVPSWATLALQQTLFPGSKAAGALVTTTIVDVCVEPEDVGPRSDLYGVLRGRIAPKNLPQGWTLNVDRAAIRFRAKDGRLLTAPNATHVDILEYTGAYSGPGRLTMSGAAPDPATFQSVEWKYDITTLEPGVSRDLPVDGRRRHLPGIGFCDAKVEFSEAITISCFKPFAQPATVGVRFEDSPGRDCANCDMASYKPGVLEGFGKSRELWISKGTATPQVVTLTTYEARAHVARRSITAGSPPMCPQRESDGKPTTLLDAV